MIMRTLRKTVPRHLVLAGLQYLTVMALTATAAAVAAHAIGERIALQFSAIAAALKKVQF